MIVGLTYNLKDDYFVDENNKNLPDDYFEEFDKKETIDAIVDVIENAGHKVIKLGYNLECILKYKSVIDIVFNIAEGLGSRNREGYIPSILDYLGIPYTGSDATALNISLDKNLCKAIARYVGVNTPDWHIINNNFKSYDEIRNFPVIVKPLSEGSSKGIYDDNIAYMTSSVISKVKDLITRYNCDVLVERFIVGYDYTVGILCDEVIGMMRIEPNDGNKLGYDWIYSLSNKRNYKESVRYVKFVKEDNDSLYYQLYDMSLKIYHTIGCKDFARVDFRVDRNGLAYFIEINPLAGLNPKDSDLIILAKMFGYSYNDVVMSILNNAIRRYNIS